MGRKLLLLGAIFAAAVVAGLGASTASAGEVTGNCNNAPNAKAKDNCKDDFSQGASICKFSGQNDYPDGSQSGPPGRTQTYGQDVRAGSADPRTENPGKVDGLTFHPGYACNPNNGLGE
jgi:hypothetical protein